MELLESRSRILSVRAGLMSQHTVGLIADGRWVEVVRQPEDDELTVDTLAVLAEMGPISPSMATAN